MPSELTLYSDNRKYPPIDDGDVISITYGPFSTQKIGSIGVIFSSPNGQMPRLAALPDQNKGFLKLGENTFCPLAFIQTGRNILRKRGKIEEKWNCEIHIIVLGIEDLERYTVGTE